MVLPNTTAESAVENGNIPDMTGERPTGTGLPKMRYVEPTPVSKVQPITQNDVATTTKVDFGGSTEVDVNPYGEVKDIKDLAITFNPPYKEETPEEKAQREKREQIKVGFTGLMDGLNALSNLYYTTKGAPSQQLQGAMPAVVGNIREQEALRRAQEQANRKAEFDWNKAMADYELERSLKAMQWDADKSKEQRTHERAIDMENLQHENTMKEIGARGENTINAENLRQKGRAALLQARINANMAKEMFRQAQITARSGNRTTSSQRTIMLSDGKVYDYDKSKEGALLGIYQEFYDSLDDKTKMVFRQAKTSTQKIALLQEYAKMYPDFDEEIKRAIGAKKAKVVEEEEDSTIPGLTGNDDDNTIPGL